MLSQTPASALAHVAKAMDAEQVEERVAEVEVDDPAHEEQRESGRILPARDSREHTSTCRYTRPEEVTLAGHDAAEPVVQEAAEPSSSTMELLSAPNPLHPGPRLDASTSSYFSTEYRDNSAPSSFPNSTQTSSLLPTSSFPQLTAQSNTTFPSSFPQPDLSSPSSFTESEIPDPPTQARTERESSPVEIFECPPSPEGKARKATKAKVASSAASGSKPKLQTKRKTLKASNSEPREKKARARPASASKGKDPASSQSAPPPSAKKAGSSTFNMTQMMGVSKPETPEQRAMEWDLRTMDLLVWVLVESGDGSFFWPGDMVSRTAVPLQVSLLADPGLEIERFCPTRTVTIETPSPDNILSFRSVAHIDLIRFDFSTFASPSLSESEKPSKAAFDSIRLRAYKLEDRREKGLGDESDGHAGGSDHEMADETLSAVQEEESDDELGDEPPPTFPFKCIGRSKEFWWPAEAVDFAPATTSQKRNGKRKYLVEWATGGTVKLGRKDILVPAQSAFCDVPIGTVELIVSKNFDAELAQDVNDGSFREILHRVMLDTFPPARVWNADFFAGGTRRDQLAHKSRYDEYTQKHQDIIMDNLRLWVEPGNDSDRPQGGADYEALEGSLRARYFSDVLVPLSIFLLVIERGSYRNKYADQGFTEDEIWTKAFEDARQFLDRGSIPKWVLAVRSAKRTADENPEGVANQRAKMARRRDRT